MSEFTQAQLDALNTALASGHLEVRYADRTVKYRSLDEMQRVKAMMMRDLNKAKRPNRVLASFGKGFAK